MYFSIKKINPNVFGLIYDNNIISILMTKKERESLYSLLQNQLYIIDIGIKRMKLKLIDISMEKEILKCVKSYKVQSLKERLEMSVKLRNEIELYLKFNSMKSCMTIAD